MRQASVEFGITTRGQGFYEVTDRVAGWVEAQGFDEGLLTLFLRHTSASMVIQENIDPDVQHDLLDFFKSLVREDNALYRHTAEGSDDQPAHIRAALTQTQLSIPVRDGRMALGRYQGIFLFEHRRNTKERLLVAHLMGA